jgi:hypothetical protein
MPARFYWGTALREQVHPFDTATASEAKMEGEQCNFCHRVKDNNKRKSRLCGNPGDPTSLGAGLSGITAAPLSVGGT